MALSCVVNPLQTGPEDRLFMKKLTELVHNLQRKENTIMKRLFLLLLLFASFFADAQSLKDALFSGKLKNDAGTVIRKGEDLTDKIDTSARKAPAVDTVAVITATATVDSITKTRTAQAAPRTQQPAAAVATEGNAAAAADTGSTAETTAETATPETAEPEAPKDNNAIWKDYMNTLSQTLKAEVLSSKKVKNGSYYVLVSYAIGTDGQTTITDVFVSPENAFLQQQIKERIALEAPKLIPVVNDAGVARKVNKKYNFTLVKE